MNPIDLKAKTNVPSHGAAQVADTASAVLPTDRRMNHKLAAVPACGNCKTETYLYIEEFTPASVGDEGELIQLAEASYFCTRCLEYAAHAVPPLWTPENRGR
ncbi:hypothetical protein [Arthrobacter castelli]|uniref:hypothetical protein n=1 Tax=Arthrobacter castelli TaxID=271431 RepID=UPI0012DD07A5|nr:hypothetical protein [Arthrobacter castelli]